MSALLETLATAFLLSALAAGGLAVLKRTPPRVRFAIAVAGLAAWIVPWGALRFSFASSAPVAAPLAEWLGAVPALGAVTALAPAPVEAGIAASLLFTYAVAAAFVVGLALFVRDYLVLRRCVGRWRACSRPADELRVLLPPELASVRAEIRLVEDSAVAAASGVLRPTIWLGDRHAAAQRALALTHEAWHVRARDPAWLLAIAAVRRLYWWNPLVARLAREAVLMLESACDHRCAAQFGTTNYVAQLAALVLEATAPPRLVATAGAGNLDVQRLRLLREPLRFRRRDVAVVAALTAASVVTAAAAVVERAPDETAPLGITLPETPAGLALAALLGAANDGNSELLVALLGAYTPQELPMPLPSSPSVRIVELLHSDPLRIEYIVESANGARHVGELTVRANAATEITATRLRPLP